MLTFLTITITLVSFCLIIAILIQNPKGGGIDANFGGQAQQLFGAARSTDVIEKATWILAAVLLTLCVLTVLVVGPGITDPTAVPLQSQ